MSIKRKENGFPEHGEVYCSFVGKARLEAYKLAEFVTSPCS